MQLCCGFLAVAPMAASGLWLGLLILWEGTESPLGVFWDFCFVWDRVCPAEDWQHKESLEKGRNAQRVTGTSSSFS